MRRTPLTRAASIAFLLTLASCANPAYVTPIEPVDLAAISDRGVRAGFAAQPLASYPAHVALVRVQSDGASGTWRPVTGLETLHLMSGARTGPADPRQVERLAELEGVVDAVAPNALVLGGAALHDLDDLRDEVAPLRPDLLVVYTLDTRLFVESDPFGFVDLVTLGFLLEDRRQVSCVASALVVDVKSGFVWSSLDARAEREDTVGRWFRPPPDAELFEDAEAEAVAALLDRLVETWPRLGDRVREAASARASGGGAAAVGSASPDTPGHVIEIP